MEQKTYIVEGTSSQKGKTGKFTKEIVAQNPNYAKEKTLSLIGSKHKIKRNAITIKQIREK